MIEIQIKGIESVCEALDKLPAAIRGDKMSDALKDAIQAIQEAARNRAPVRWGILAEDIMTRVSRRDGGKTFVGKIGVTSKQYEIGVATKGRRKGKPIVEQPTRIVKIIEFGNSHQAAEPFLRPALDSQATNAVARLIANLNDAIDEYVEKNGAL